MYPTSPANQRRPGNATGFAVGGQYRRGILVKNGLASQRYLAASRDFPTQSVNVSLQTTIAHNCHNLPKRREPCCYWS